MGFDRSTTVDEVVADADLSGRVAVVTGASSGLGREVAQALARSGATVVAAVRDPARAPAGITSVTLDLASLASVGAAAAAILDTHATVDILVNNAGVMATPPEVTLDGFESQLGINHLGHFLFTALLASALGDSGRVVNTSSLGHMISPMRWDDPHFRTQGYDKWLAYGQSKTANILFTRALAARGRRSYAVHPGAVDTGLTRHLEGDELALVEAAGLAEAKTLAQGAATLVLAAVSDTLLSGSYLADCQIAEPASHARDPDEAERLWNWSEGELGHPWVRAV